MRRLRQPASRDGVVTHPVHCFEGATLDEVQASVERIQPGMRIAPLEGKAVAGGFIVIESGPLRLIEGTWSTGAQLTALGQRFMLATSVAGTSRHDHRGQQLAVVPGRSAILGVPGASLSSRLPPGFQGRSVSIDPAVIEEYAALIRGTPPGAPSELPVQIDLTRGVGVTVEPLISLLWKVVPQVNTSPLLLANLRDALLTTLVTAPLAKHDSIRVRPAMPSRALVRLVEDYVDAHVREPLGLTDLIAVAGVSARTLQTGFFAVHGMSPMRYVQQRRLACAREDLLRAAPGVTVAEVARRLGFASAGRFSLAYRQCFGESPSQTRARAMR